MYEGIVLDREEVSRLSLKAFYIWLVDFLAFRSAHVSLVESLSQKKFLVRLFKIKEEKLKITLTGANDKIFYPNPYVKKRDEFCAVFRGQFLPATGIEYVIEAARILKNKDVNFLIIGRGMLKKRVWQTIQEFNLKNAELITEYLSDNDLREKMLSCHVILGQFADHPRMDRTIQNKTFEALALSMPYITRDSRSNREILQDRENCLFVRPADARDLAEKILELKNNPELQKKIAQNGYKLYKEKLTPKILGRELLDNIQHLFKSVE
ncbi:glycosyltransferase [candidate division KSB1 bacterium]|nr:glycosyltransferase [candidate division KSB1 bacterium]